MKPYIVVVETFSNAEKAEGEIRAFERLEEAWEYAREEASRGKFAYPCCVLVAPSILKRLPQPKPKEFQGPGTSGHPKNCGCAACRNFDD